MNSPSSPVQRATEALSGVRPVLKTLAAAFAAAGYSLYLVGGSVRDAFLGRLSHDLDFTTPARPDIIKKILEGVSKTVWDTGIEYGTVSATVADHVVEITTFRADSYDGKSRNPSVTFGDTVEGDLIRRDFTVNAMAFLLAADGSPSFVDPVGGFNDLLAGVLDTPSTPEQSFHDDPLRMLRAARFVSQLSFEVAPRVKEAMIDMADEINRITTERIHAELNKLMAGVAPWVGLDLMVETGLCDFILPEIPALKLEPDEHMRHKDVYAHSLQVLQQAMGQEEDGPDLVLRWAALLHDIGKPATRAPKPGGGVTFHQHEVVGAKMARRRLKALKFARHDITDIGQLVFLHMRFHGYGEGAWTDSAVRRYVTDAGELLPRLNKLVRADVTTRNKRKALRLARAYDDLENRIEELAEKEDLAKVRPDLDGNDIMEILGLTPGRAVGDAWNHMKEIRLDRGPMSREDAVAELTRWWSDYEGGSPS